MKTSILLIDDDRELVDLLAFALGKAGFAAIRATDKRSALQSVDRWDPSIAILEIGPEADTGFELLRSLRAHNEFPIVVLTSRATEEDKIQAFDLGADDYVTKPFSHRELIARIRAHLRRHQLACTTVSAPLMTDEVLLDPNTHSITLHGRSAPLTDTEFRLLHLLLQNSGSLVRIGAILKHIWGDDSPTRTDLVRVAVYRLRRKFEEHGLPSRALRTIPRVGIVFDLSEGLCMVNPLHSSGDEQGPASDTSSELPEREETNVSGELAPSTIAI